MTRCHALCVSLFALLLVGAPGALQAENTATEEQKIDALIQHVEGLKSARFLLANRVFHASDAAKFLKWSLSRTRVKTAEEFIGKIASYYMGRAFTIRFDNGKTMRSGDYLRGELKKLEGLPSEKLAEALALKTEPAKATPAPRVPGDTAKEASPATTDGERAEGLTGRRTLGSRLQQLARHRSSRRGHRLGANIISPQYAKKETPKLTNQA